VLAVCCLLLKSSGPNVGDEVASKMSFQYPNWRR